MWIQDLKFGTIGEKTVCKRLSNQFDWQYHSHSSQRDKNFDLKFSDGFYTIVNVEKIYQTITVEVKTDQDYFTRGHDTGNMVIEVSCRDIPSGPLHGTSDYLAYYYPFNNEIWFIKIDKLKRLMQENYTRRVRGGDRTIEYPNGKCWMYLIEREKYRNEFTII